MHLECTRRIYSARCCLYRGNSSEYRSHVFRCWKRVSVCHSVYLSEAKRSTQHDFKSFRSIGTSVQCPQIVKEFEDRPTDSSSVQRSK